MLASTVEKPFDRAGWIFEIKWDGYRAIAEVEQGGEVRLYSRRLLSFIHRYSPIVQSLAALGHDAVLDGEIVVLDGAGRPRFQLLQEYQSARHTQLFYYVFDLLYLDGHDLRNLPLLDRKRLLERIVPSGGRIRFSEHIEQHGTAFFEAISGQQLEGIIAKRATSPYRVGHRTSEWLKIKCRQTQDAVIAGFTDPRGKRQGLGALVLGVYDNGELVYCGHSGSGFSEKVLDQLYATLKPLVRAQCPFRKRPKTNAPVHWVDPQLVCGVQFQEWSREGIMRQPIFQGLRDDKQPHEVRRETGPEEERPEPDSEPSRPGPIAMANTNARDNSMAKPNAKRPKKKQRRQPQKVAPKVNQTQLAIDGQSLKLTNLNKVFWPDEGYAKRDVIDYYRTIAPVILPYLYDRPENLNRHPNGITGENFYQKNAGKYLADWIPTVPLESESRAEPIEYLLCQDEATLVYLANLGCIELNPWSSRVDTIDRPDYLIIDLDPVEVPFHQVVEVALAVRKLLDQAEVASHVKTSGKRGMHIYVPVGARHDYDHARQFAQIIAYTVNSRLPHLTSVERMPAKRQHRVYLDFLQNRRGQTLAAPYSIRPWPGATVSTPLKWAEVKKGLDPSKHTIKTVPSRIDKMGDIWQPVLHEAIDLEKSLELLDRAVRR